MNPPSPAIVAQNAVRTLPRWALWLLCAAYIFPGFIGRSPWRDTDIVSFGYMRSLAAGDTSWLHPSMLGLSPSTEGLLPYWLGAWALQLFPSSWSAEWVVRLPFIGLLILTFMALWWAVYYLARTPGAQPVAFAFGGEARPQDYARAMADGGLLALMACLGLAQFSHETSSYLAQLAFATITLLAAASMAYHPRIAAALTGVGLMGLALSGAPSMAVIMGLGVALLTWRTRGTDLRYQGTWAAWWLCAVAFTSFIAWKLGLWEWRLINPWVEGKDWQSQGRLLTWFSWPAWPLALWTLWRWRQQLAAPSRHTHLILPLWLWILAVAATLTTLPADRALLLGLPAISALAAFALPTLKRSLGALIDWFTLLFFTVAAITIWVVWISLQTGVPAQPAANVARLAPGFTPSFAWFPFAVALAATVGWLLLVAWRTRRHRAAIWKSLVLPAGGATLGWVLLMTLWLPALDYGRGDAPYIRQVQAAIPADASCVNVAGLGRTEVAALQYYTPWKLQLFRVDRAQQCEWTITEPAYWANLSTAATNSWKQHTIAVRPTDKKDRLLILQRH